MTTLTIKVPDSKAKELSTYAQKIGGEVVTPKKEAIEVDEDDEVTHEQFFGENIKRFIKAFSSK
jgi:hypothetical protein